VGTLFHVVIMNCRGAGEAKQLLVLVVLGKEVVFIATFFAFLLAAMVATVRGLRATHGEDGVNVVVLQREVEVPQGRRGRRRFDGHRGMRRS